MEARVKQITNILDEKNLKYPQNMELFDDKTYLRDLNTIAQRAIATAIMAKCACDLYDAEQPDKTKADCLAALKNFGVENCLFEAEQKILTDDYNEPQFDAVAWTYEAAKALLWAMGLLDDIVAADLPEDVVSETNKVFELINAYNRYDDFIAACNLRTEPELQDAYQLYWYYHWNIRDGQIFGNRPKSISYDVVLERRRALQWLLYSDESYDGDWNFAMDT